MSAIASAGHSAHLSTDWRRSAGDFSCSGPCRRKRLPASAFSKTQARKAIAGVRTSAHGEKRALCKQCVEEASVQTASSATLSVARDQGGPDDAGTDQLHCAACDRDLPAASFSKSQKTRITRDKPGRCLACVEAAEEAELQHSADKRAAEASALAATIKKSGSRGGSGVAARLALACAETAAEAETITGLTAKKSNRGRRRRGGGSWRGGGRGRGRGGRRRGKG